MGVHPSWTFHLAVGVFKQPALVPACVDELSGFSKEPYWDISRNCTWQPQSFSLVTTEKQNDKPQKRGGDLQLRIKQVCQLLPMSITCSLLFLFYLKNHYLTSRGPGDRRASHVPGSFEDLPLSSFSLRPSHPLSTYYVLILF